MPFSFVIEDKLAEYSMDIKDIYLSVLESDLWLRKRTFLE